MTIVSDRIEYSVLTPSTTGVGTKARAGAGAGAAWAGAAWAGAGAGAGGNRGATPKMPPAVTIEVPLSAPKSEVGDGDDISLVGER